MTSFLIVLALACTPFTWVLIAGGIVAAIVTRAPKDQKEQTS